jgi:dTMP kinase
MNKGKLIAIEGIDGVGKNTQALKLYETIKANIPGDHLFISFPQYQSPTGKLISEYLNGKVTDTSRYYVAEMYADDRLAHKQLIVDTLNSGNHVVADRYVLSNIAYQSSYYRTVPTYSKLNTDFLIDIMINYITSLEYVENRMPEPDMTLVLTLPVEVACTMIMQKGLRSYTDKKKDIYEENMPLQAAVAEFYSKTYHKGSNEIPTIVNCWNKDNGSMLSVETISEMVNNYVESEIPNLRGCGE